MQFIILLCICMAGWIICIHTKVANIYCKTTFVIASSELALYVPLVNTQC